MSVVASNVGAAALAAHRVVLSLWMVTSYVCDGYANVGTMLGAKLIGARRAAEVRVLRNFLVAFAAATGLLAAAALAAWGAEIVALYSVVSVLYLPLLFTRILLTI
jgi:Na+-driven multidrug efflux pump